MFSQSYSLRGEKICLSFTLTLSLSLSCLFDLCSPHHQSVLSSGRGEDRGCHWCRRSLSQVVYCTISTLNFKHSLTCCTRQNMQIADTTVCTLTVTSVAVIGFTTFAASTAKTALTERTAWQHGIQCRCVMLYINSTLLASYATHVGFGCHRIFFIFQQVLFTCI